MNKVQLIFPCRIDWETMQEHEKGKLCTACKKEVRDYTQGKIDTSSELFCGRFSSDQLSHPVSHYELRNFKTLSLSLFSLLSGAVSAQQPDTAGVVQNAAPDPHALLNARGFHTDFSKLRFPLSLEGRIRDKSDGKAIANAHIRLLQYDSVIYTTKTDTLGNFSFLLEDKDMKDSIFDLRVSYQETDKPHLSDSLLQIPLQAAAVNRNSVFALEFQVKPAPLTVGALIREPFTLGGVPMIPFSISGTASINPVFTISPLSYTVQTVMDSSASTSSEPGIKPAGTPSVLPPKREEASVKGSWANGIWLVLGACMIFIFAVFRRRRKDKRT